MGKRAAGKPLPPPGPLSDFGLSAPMYFHHRAYKGIRFAPAYIVPDSSGPHQRALPAEPFTRQLAPRLIAWPTAIRLQSIEPPSNGTTQLTLKLSGGFRPVWKSEDLAYPKAGQHS
jgi:hypothetical protein